MGAAFWNKTNTLKFIALAAADVEPREIARELGCKPKSIIQKLDRMAQNRVRKRGHVRMEVRAPEPVLVPVKLMQLTNTTCRWPLWQENTPEAQRLFCGADAPGVDKGLPYCREHTGAAYQKTNPDGRVQANYRPYYPGEGRLKETR